MKAYYTKRFQAQLDELPLLVRKKCEKQIDFLVGNLRHPSLKAKKYDESRDIWQARVNGGYRFYFRILKNTYELLFVIPHPK